MTDSVDKLRKQQNDLFAILEKHGLQSNIALTDELLYAITRLIDAAYRSGYNDNARDCLCDSLTAIPHHHLLDDGQSYDIQPDIRHTADTTDMKGGE